MTHLLIPSIIGGISLLILCALSLFITDSLLIKLTSHPIANAIGNLVFYLYFALSGSLLIFAALPEYSFITHLAFETSYLPLMAGLLYALVAVYIVYRDVQENGMRVILTDIALLICLAMLPVLLIGAIPYQPWMTPVAAFILIGNMIMAREEKNRKKRLAPETSAA